MDLDMYNLINNFKETKKEVEKEYKKSLKQQDLVCKYEFAKQLEHMIKSKKDIFYPLSISCENVDGTDVSVGVFHITDKQEKEYSDITSNLYAIMNKGIKGKINVSFQINEGDNIFEKTLKNSE